MGRFTIMERPQMLPGQCLLTRNSNEKYYVDTGLDFIGYGRVYIGASALEEIIGMLGWVTPEKADHLRNENSYLETQLAQKTIQNDHLMRGLNELRAALYPDGSVHPFIDPGLIVPTSSDAGSEDGSQREGESLGERTGESSEQIDDEGVGELRTDSESERSGGILIL